MLKVAIAAITLNTLSTCSCRSAHTPVTGLIPPFARVAAITPRSRQVTAMEHCRK